MEIWLISFIVLWLLVLFQLFVFFVLARQIGILHMRIRPTGARMTNDGLEIGQAAPPFYEQDISGRFVSLGVDRHRPTLLIFIAPGCSVCADLMPSIRTLAHREKQVDLVLISLQDNDDENRDYQAQHQLQAIPYLVSTRLAKLYDVVSPPYAMLIDRNGKVFTKGMVDRLEHLESLLNALDEGQPSYDHKMQLIHAATTKESHNA